MFSEESKNIATVSAEAIYDGKSLQTAKISRLVFTLCADTLNGVVLKGLGHPGQQTVVLKGLGHPGQQTVVLKGLGHPGQQTVEANSLQKLFPLANTVEHRHVS